MLIGDDSGGRGFLTALSDDPAVHASDLDPEHFEPVGADLATWVASLDGA